MTQPPETPAQIADYLRDLSERMLTCGTAMDYYGGFGNALYRGQQLLDASLAIAHWADEIDADAARKKDSE